MTNKPNIRTLLQKYVDNTICREEYEELVRSINLPDNEEDRHVYVTQMLQSSDISTVDRDQLSLTIARIDQKIENQILSSSRRISIKKLYPYAAALLLFFIGITVYYTNYHTVQEEPYVTASEDIDPGSNRATLSFEDGSTVNLNEAQSGIIVGHDITYTDGTAVMENKNDLSGNEHGKKNIAYATLRTPRGGQYRITLPDGSKVFLNAESSLRYPTLFAEDKRIVELQGEAYFEVTHDENRAFFVKGDQQEIKVLGTTFNVSDYAGEIATTTLSSGSIALSQHENAEPILLLPGQQAVIVGNKADIRHVDAEDYMAWTRDLFVFNDAPLTEIMKQLERWYDIEVIYPANLREERFYAEVPRNRRLSEVLQSLERSGNFKFEQQERRVIVHQ